LKVHYHRKFLKDLAALPKSKREIVEYFAFKLLEEVDSFNEIKNLRKLQGHDNAYRVRFGDYRLGFIILESGEICLERVMHRGHFYKQFP
jgi:mRNA interferase RelE/StbE